MEEPVHGNTVEPPAAGKVAISAKNGFGPSTRLGGKKGRAGVSYLASATTASRIN